MSSSSHTSASDEIRPKFPLTKVRMDPTLKSQSIPQSPNSPSTPQSPNSPSTSRSPNSRAEEEDTSSEIFYPCSFPDCDYKSNWKENVGRHEKRHNPSGYRDFFCQICPRNYRSLVSFLHHMSSQHSKNNELSCPFCHFIGQEFSEFKAHMLAHSMTQSVSSNGHSNNVKPVSRVKAQKQKSNGQKRSQIKSKTPKNSTSSNITIQQPKIKMEPSILQSVLTETGFNCAGCSKSFTLKCNLLRHQRKSCSNSNFKKSITNSRKTQVKVEVDSTEPSSASVGPHKCPHCSKRFEARSVMFRHIKSHRKNETNGPKNEESTRNRDDELTTNRDESTRNQMDESERHLTDEFTRNLDESARNRDESARNRDELTRNRDELTRNRDESTSIKMEESKHHLTDEFTRTLDESARNRDESTRIRDDSTRNNQTDELCCPYPDCGYKTNRPITLRTHIRFRHEFVPKIEPTDHPEAQPYQDIEQAGERRALLSCDKCTYKTSFGHNMKMHSRIHSGEKPFKCRNGACDYSARWAHNLRVHQRSCRHKKLKRLEVIVPKIQKKPTRVVRVKETKKIQVKIEAAENYSGGEAELETAHAQPTVPQEVRLASTQEIPTSVPQEMTPQISKTVAQKSNDIPMEEVVESKSQLPPGELIKKVSVGGETLFRCVICGYKSKWKPNLKSHLMVHTDLKPFACPIGSCQYRSKWSQCVRQHARIVHQIDLPPKMKLDCKENLGSDCMAFISAIPIKSEREISQLDASSLAVKNPRLQRPSKIGKNSTQNYLREPIIEKSPPKFCLFCDYASKLSKYLRKHLQKCSSCSVIKSGGAQEESKDKEINADLNSAQWVTGDHKNVDSTSTNDNGTE